MSNNWIFDEILKREENELKELGGLEPLTYFKKLSKIKQKLLMILLCNFMRVNSIKKYESVYEELYFALEPGNSTINSLVKSIEDNFDNINNIDLNLLFNTIINNRFNISNINELQKYAEYQKKDFEEYKNKIGLYEKKEIILQHYFNISCKEAQNLMNKYGNNKEIVNKYKYFFDDISLILNSYELPNDLKETESLLKCKYGSYFLKTCNYYSMDLKFKQEWGRQLKRNLFTISDAVSLNSIQKDKIRKTLQQKGIFDDSIIEEMYQIPYYSNGDKQPFTMLLKGVRYINSEFGDYSTTWQEKKFNPVSGINDKMIGLFALNHFFLGYNIEANNICLASIRDGGSDATGVDCSFNPKMADERYLDIDEFIFETANTNFFEYYDGNDQVSYSYNEIIIDNCKPSFIVCLKIGNNIKNLRTIVEAREKYIKSGIKLPVLILDLSECLNTQINNIINKYNEFISTNGNIETFDSVLQINWKLKKLYIQSLATVTFINEETGNKFNLKDEINKRISMNKSSKQYK